jgi:hypothetical protein
VSIPPGEGSLSGRESRSIPPEVRAGVDAVIGELVAAGMPQQVRYVVNYRNAVLACAKALRDEGKNLRKIADALASEFNLKKLDATSVKRILNRA